ncbi:Protein CBG24864 [Caenorhabditis briggsae]|uniref:Protein CBG24864 n=1 Tax=Caenorhabditis briggsae TaxID=6238 RepID=A8WLN0_CAEBR|nr:Protein CBG24864 [Caenorhabditis briggsae]CAP21376.2 Protein CBG24864 [Caenorhabditis briggsae]
MNLTLYSNTTLLEPPRTLKERFFLLIFVMFSTFQFLGRLCDKRKLIWKTFPHFCLLMTFIPITHMAFLIVNTFRNLLFTSKLGVDEILWRLLPVIITCYPILFFPPVPFCITMVYSIFLNIKMAPGKHLFGQRATKGERCLVISINFDDHPSLQLDMLKYLPVLITTLYYSRRLYFFKSAKRPIKVYTTEYIRMIYIALFLLVFYVLTLPQILISFLTHHTNFYSYPTRLLGFQES